MTAVGAGRTVGDGRCGSWCRPGCGTGACAGGAGAMAADEPRVPEVRAARGARLACGLRSGEERVLGCRRVPAPVLLRPPVKARGARIPSVREACSAASAERRAACLVPRAGRDAVFFPPLRPFRVLTGRRGCRGNHCRPAAPAGRHRQGRDGDPAGTRVARASGADAGTGAARRCRRPAPVRPDDMAVAVALFGDEAFREAGRQLMTEMRTTPDPGRMHLDGPGE